jgi:hypothetical protein
MLELVKNCKNIADVLKEYDNDIKKFLRHHNPDPSGPYGIKAEALKTFVKSCGKLIALSVIKNTDDVVVWSCIVFGECRALQNTTRTHFFPMHRLILSQ